MCRIKSAYHTAFFAFSCIVLFLHGLKGFSKELKETGGDHLRYWLTRITNNRFKALALGARTRSTSTALIASMKMKVAARLSALSNFIFNLTGGLIFVALTGPLAGLVSSWTPVPGFQVAYAHIIFSISIAILFFAIPEAFCKVYGALDARQRDKFGEQCSRIAVQGFSSLSGKNAVTCGPFRTCS